MSDAPGKIWTRPSVDMEDEPLPYGEWHIEQSPRWTEYTRSDLCVTRADLDAAVALALEEALNPLLNLVEEFVTATWHLLDNSETSGPVGNPTITVWQPDFDNVSGLLDRCEGLPSGSTEHMTAGELLVANIRALIQPHQADALARVRQEAHNAARDDWDELVAEARDEAAKAMRKFPQPNYVISKIAEEAGEVVKAAIHCAEGRETMANLRGEMKQTLAMLYRLWVEGDQVHGLPPVSVALALPVDGGAKG